MRAKCVVATDAGRVRGSTEPPGVVFRGIPFAAPPLGPLRFAAPQPVARWTGVREARAFPPAPPQSRDPLLETLGLLWPDTPQSEDCLALNVFTPACDDARRPVMVWVHGGAFTSGTGSVPLYDGSRLSQDGDVVVVTLNYRVGAIGFLSLDALPGAAAGAGSNRGLLDQIEALRWVRRNIAGFGGDPSNVTLFGESAGAGSILSLLAMPAALGLFRRAIVQSAAPTGMLDAGEARRRSERMLAALAIAPGDAASLAQVPVDELLQAQSDCAGAEAWRTGMFFVPVVDAATLPEMPMRAIARGSAKDVDLLIGTTAQEMRLYAYGAHVDGMSDAALASALASELPGRARPGSPHAGEPDAEWVLAAYRALREERGEPVRAMDLLLAIQSDTRLRLHSTQVADRHAAQGAGRTFMYLFTWRSPLQGGELGACHALDLPFTFGTLDAPGMPAFAGAGSPAWRVSDAMRSAWTSFARSGVPSCDPLGSWPVYDRTRRATVELCETPRVLEDPFAREREILEGIDFEVFQ